MVATGGCFDLLHAGHARTLAAARDLVDRYAGTGRVLTHTIVHPNFGPAELDAMADWRERLRPSGWKTYTLYGPPTKASPSGGWFLDDEIDMIYGPGEGYEVMQQRNDELADDGRSRWANYGKGVLFWETDEEAATANPFFPRRVAHGYLLVSWAAGLFVEPAPGPVLANYGLENLRFITPVTYDDHIRVTLTAKQITPRVTDEYGEVCWDAILHNQHDEIVATYDVLILVAKTWPTA